MTLPDLDEHEEEQDILSQSVVEALIRVIQQAIQHGRLTCGVQNCINLLGSSPEKVMLCLLAQNSAGQEALVKIQHILIRAFCQENGLDLLHVEDDVKLTQLILTSQDQLSKSMTSQVIKPPLEENTFGYSCMMIQYPDQKDTTHEEDTVSEYIKHQLQANTLPYVTLPA